MTVNELIKRIKDAGFGTVYKGAAVKNAPLPYVIVNGYAQRLDIADDRIDDRHIYIQADYYARSDSETEPDRLMMLLDECGTIVDVRREYDPQEEVNRHSFDVRL